jgi:demethylmenaquinone methyltransferase / 2-methoxy-6-polyprenyl-1,4-benzoquinol methylase
VASPRNRFAIDLFGPIANDYERWSRVLSFGQDPLWRKRMVAGLGLNAGSFVLDVAAGTGEVTRLLSRRGCKVVSLDQSMEMLSLCARRGATTVRGRAEQLPFPDDLFDGLTFTYLLRYVDDQLACMRELARVVKPGGVVGMVEFGRPKNLWGPLWRFYTRACLPAAGAIISPGWRTVGRFLGPSIDDFHRRLPEEGLVRIWKDAGLVDVQSVHMSLGGGLILWGRKT